MVPLKSHFSPHHYHHCLKAQISQIEGTKYEAISLPSPHTDHSVRLLQEALPWVPGKAPLLSN